MASTTQGDEIMAPLENDLILRVARGEVGERIPVWVMRQAGRYMEEFRDLRSRYDFFQICETPELSCEATLQPIKYFEGLLDAAIIFSDILVVVRALGLNLRMDPGVGPVVEDALVKPSDMSRLRSEEEALSSLKYVYDAIRLTRKALNGKVPLIGFAGGPWTLMKYILESPLNKKKNLCKRWIFKYPNESAKLLGLITKIVTKFLIEQAKAGAQMLQVFESWAGELSPQHFIQYIYPYLLEIAENVKKTLSEIPNMPYVPIAIFPRGICDALSFVSFPPYDVVSIDWSADPKRVRAYFPCKTLQGNLDPLVLLGTHEFIRSETFKMIKDFDASKPYIANLGHGIDPETDPGHLRTFLSAIREINPCKF